MKPTRVILREGRPPTDLEPMLRDLHKLASGGSTIADQMAGEVRTCVFNTSNPPTVSTSLQKRPAMVLCLSATLVTSATSSLSGLPVEWSYGGTSTNPTVTIANLIGATASVDYNVTLWISEG